MSYSDTYSDTYGGESDPEQGQVPEVSVRTRYARLWYALHAKNPFGNTGWSYK